ncbi:methyl-accepting chemotaxis protein [Photobacterium frigidiphilum]|uniref:Methyl-accepting chemotaxis protein n=1 Tax=Photobacterium frigidiphilum TaxID=264736 RepID=A0A2T3JNL1_9GAMM|nr:methyl-accepting chemotaxis protein [Photobacterium frigidiphilum]PSU50626.1 methyl-accepting chemotaxis protein [Photobacterium frigidiphilum]
MNILSSFKGRIIAVVVLLLTASLAISTSLSYRQLSTSILSNVDEYSMLKISSSSDKITDWFNTIKQGVIATAPDFATDRGDMQLALMVKQIANATQSSDIVVGFEDGRSYGAQSGMRSVFIYDPRTRGWYKSAKQKRSTVITGIYTGSSSGNLMVSIAEPFFDGDKFRGVLLADIELSLLTDVVNQSPFPGAMTGLYDNQGTTIASTGEVDVPGKTKLSDFPELAELERKVLTSASGIFNYSLGGIEKIAYFQTIELDKETHWHLLVGIDKSMAYAEVDEALETSLFTAGLLILFASAIILFVLNRLYRPILALKSTIVELSQGNGDLTRRLDVYTKDDLGQIAEAVNTFIGNLQAMMLEVSQSSEHISEGIEQLKTQTELNDTVLASHSVETDQVVTAVNEMSSTADSVSQSASQSAAFTKNTSDEAEQSKRVVDGAVSSVAALVDEVDAMALNIQTMSDDAQKIGSVLSVIGEIADQTNLLALNAAIEAARAGDQGRGFAVVADEVRALAARTQQSTSEINEMLSKLHQGTSSVVTAMDDTKRRCQQTADTTSNVNDSLDSMATSVVQINDLGIQIAAAAEQQSVVSEEINRNMTAIQDMVGQLTENGAQTMDSTRNLASSNEQLAAIVNQFKLK